MPPSTTRHSILLAATLDVVNDTPSRWDSTLAATTDRSGESASTHRLLNVTALVRLSVAVDWSTSRDQVDPGERPERSTGQRTARQVSLIKSIAYAFLYSLKLL